MPRFPASLLLKLEFIASSYLIAGKVVRASLQVWPLVSEGWVVGCFFSPNRSLIYFVCLLVSPASRNSDMINGGGSGIVNDDLITNAEEKSSTENKPWEITLTEEIYVLIPYKPTSNTANLHCVLESSSLFDILVQSEATLLFTV